MLPFEGGVSPTGTMLATITTTHAGIAILEKLHTLYLLHVPVAGVRGPTVGGAVSAASYEEISHILRRPITITTHLYRFQNSSLTAPKLPDVLVVLLRA